MKRRRVGLSPIDIASDIARTYRASLVEVDPEACAVLDAQMRKDRQWWVLPSDVAAEDVDLDAELTAMEFERVWGVPANTIWTWVARGLLSCTNPEAAAAGATKTYRVRDVNAVHSRRLLRYHRGAAVEA